MVGTAMSVTWFVKAMKVSIFVVMLGLFVGQSSLVRGECNGTPAVDKWVSPPSVEAGDPVTVLIAVVGCSGEVSEPIPFDGVLLIDMSNSMDDDWPYSDPNDFRLDAAISFVNCVAQDTELAIVTFSNDATLVQAMTSDKAVLRSKLDGLRGSADGGTNMFAGMELAQQHLTGSSSGQRERFIILLTDGEDNSGHSDNEFVTLANSAADYDIHYLNIALGSEADLLTLVAIAQLTGGQWFSSATASDLQGVYDIICAYAGSIAKTRQIVLNEKLRAGLSVVPGSVTSDISLTASEVAQFEATGHVIGNIGTLESNEGRFLQFDIVADCLTPDSEAERVELQIDDASSKVTYIFGVNEGELPIPEGSFECTRPGDLRVKKEYDFQDSKLYITLESRYLPGTGNNIIRDIKVIETPSIYFQANPTSASPSLSYLFPSGQNDTLVWKIAELGPKETKTLNVDLEPIVCSANYHPPIDVNAQKATGGSPGEISYVRPDGTANRIPMPREVGSLPSVDSCDGRPDLGIAPAFTFSEYQFPPPISPVRVLYSQETPWIWVDSFVENGFWDGTSENVGDFITGAELSGATAAPLERRIKVQGQGDYFHVSSKNKIFVKVMNFGDKPSEDLDPGIKLLVFNHTTNSWNMIGAQRLEALGINEERLLVFKMSPDEIRPEHIEPYAMPLNAAMRVVQLLDPGLTNRIGSWANEHPSEWNSLASQGNIVPEDVLNLLPDQCPWYDPFCLFTETLHDRFQEFLDEGGSYIAWGKPSMKIQVNLASTSLERHTNNNSSSEVIMVRE